MNSFTKDTLKNIIKNIKTELPLELMFNEDMVYNALAIELKNNNISYEKEKTVPIYYKNYAIGTNKIDMLIDSKIIIKFIIMSYTVPTSNFNKENFLKSIKQINCEGAIVYLYMDYFVIDFFNKNGFIEKYESNKID